MGIFINIITIIVDVIGIVYAIKTYLACRRDILSYTHKYMIRDYLNSMTMMILVACVFVLMLIINVVVLWMRLAC